MPIQLASLVQQALASAHCSRSLLPPCPTHRAASRRAPGTLRAGPSRPPASGTPRHSRGSPPPCCMGREARGEERQGGVGMEGGGEPQGGGCGWRGLAWHLKRLSGAAAGRCHGSAAQLAAGRHGSSRGGQGSRAGQQQRGTAKAAGQGSSSGGGSRGGAPVRCDDARLHDVHVLAAHRIVQPAGLMSDKWQRIPSAAQVAAATGCDQKRAGGRAERRRASQPSWTACSSEQACSASRTAARMDPPPQEPAKPHERAASLTNPRGRPRPSQAAPEELGVVVGYLQQTQVVHGAAPCSHAAKGKQWEAPSRLGGAWKP